MKAFAKALLDSSSAAARVGPKSNRPSEAKRSATPALSGNSGPTIGEVDSFGVGNRREIVRTRNVRRHGSCERGDPGITGSAHDVWRIGIVEQPGNQRVFPGPATDHENSHRCNDLGVDFGG